MTGKLEKRQTTGSPLNGALAGSCSKVGDNIYYFGGMLQTSMTVSITTCLNWTLPLTSGGRWYAVMITDQWGKFTVAWFHSVVVVRIIY